MSNEQSQEMDRKFHFGLTVSDLNRSVEFYRILFGVDPVKHFDDYAKFDVVDPPVVLALHPGKFSTSGALNHVGFRVTNSAAIVKVQERLERSGIATTREEGVECCYALQTKFWVPDPDGNLWEVYTLHEDLDHSGFGGDNHGMPPQSEKARPAVIWNHMLTQAIPAVIPFDNESVDEIRLEGTFNMSVPAEQRQALIREAFRVLRPGGSVWIHGLVSDRPFVGKPSLPGPAAMVQWIPMETVPEHELKAAGFVGLNYDKLGDIHCFQVNGVELRQLQLTAVKPAATTTANEYFVLYRGPHSRVTDDAGRVFERGVRKSMDHSTWQLFREAPYVSHFTCFRCAGATL